MNSSCIRKQDKEKLAASTLESFSKEKRKEYGITADNEHKALDVLYSLIGSELHGKANRDEILSSVEKFTEFLDSFAELPVSNEDYKDAIDAYNLFVDNYGKLSVFDMSVLSQEERDGMEKTLASFGDILKIYRDADEDILRIIAKKPIKSGELTPQEKTMEAIRTIAGFQSAQEFEDENGETYLVDWSKGERARKGSKKTGRYKYRGRMVNTKTVSEDVYGPKDDEHYPVLSSPIGDAVDEVGRLFFNKTSSLWNQDGTLVDNDTLQKLIDKELNRLFTVEGLRNLIGDFETLEKKLRSVWEDCQFFSGNIPLFGKISDDEWITGKPDLLVVDKEGVVHVFDFKTKKINTTDGIDGYQTVLNDKYNTGIHYGEQLSRYIRVLQSFGLDVEETPYLILADTWYDSSDLGEWNEDDSQKIYSVQKGTKKGEVKGIFLEENEERGIKEQSLGEYAGNMGNPTIQDVFQESGRNLLYIEPRLHIAISEENGTVSFSKELAAIRSTKEGVPFDNKTITYEQQFLSATREEQEALEYLDGRPKKRDAGQSIVKLSESDIESDKSPIGHQELQEVAEFMMYGVSDLITFLQQGVDFDDLPLNNMELKGKSRDFIINSIGINTLIDYVFANKIALAYDSDFPVWNKEMYPTYQEFLNNTEIDEDWYEFENEEDYLNQLRHNQKAKWLIDHKDQFIRTGFTKLMALENVRIPTKKEKDNKLQESSPNTGAPENSQDIILDSGDNESTEEFVELYIEGLTDIEAWMMGARNYSAKASLAKEIRSMLESIWLLDKDGNIINDPYNWNFPMHLDSTMAMQTLLDACKDCETFGEMKAAMEGLAKIPENTWINSVLKKLDEDKNLKTKFFRHFRKDALTYSISSVKFDKKTGKRVVETRVINTRSAFSVISNSLSASFMEGTVGAFKLDPSNPKSKEVPMISGGAFSHNGVKLVYSLIQDRKRKLTEEIKEIYSRRGSRKGDELTEYIIDEFTKKRPGKYTIIEGISSVLNGIGIRVPEDVILNCISANVARSYTKSYAGQLLDNANKVIDTLVSQVNEKHSMPDGLAGNDAFRYYAPILNLISDHVQQYVEASVYQDGKTYYSYTNPSRLGHIIRNLKDAMETFDEHDNDTTFGRYLHDSFGRYTGWFRDVSDEKWLNDWLRQFSTDEDARVALAHKVELSYIGNHYRDLGSLGFQLSILHNYFGTKNDPEGTRWFALPTMSNKPTNEFIRMRKYGDKRHNYKDEIVSKVLMNTFQQELNRIADTLYHYTHHTTAVDQMDLTDDKVRSIYEPMVRAKYAEDLKDSSLSKKKKNEIEERIEEEISQKIEALKDRIDNSELTYGDLLDLGTLTSGAKFHFLWYLNTEFTQTGIDQNRDYCLALVNKINLLLTPNNDENADKRRQLESNFDGVKFLNDAEKLIRKNMDDIVRAELNNMHKIGLFDTKEVKFKDKNDKEVTETHLRYWEEFDEKLGEKESEEAMEKELTEFIWQDIAANINIIQLTGGDLAYYGTDVNYQKRIAQIHSPGLHLIHDEEYDDGFFRSVHISDEKAISEVMINAVAALEEYRDSINDAGARKEYDAIIKVIRSGFKKIDVTDGQSYSSPTSKRKKLALQGEWTTEREDAYREILKGNFNITNLGIMLQPEKPFVTSDMAKYSGSPTMTLRRVPLQDKNSEYLILLAEALSRGAGKRSKMSAIFDFMEATARDKNGNPTKTGIDTVHFASVGKVGLSGIIDINAFDREYKGSDKNYNKELTKYLLGHVARQDVQSRDVKSRQSEADRIAIDNLVNEGKLKPEEAYYNPQYVDTIPVEDYIIQQEVPAHLLDPNGQLYGSQIRILGISDITPGTEFNITDSKGNPLNSETLVNEYKELHAANIRESFNSLMKELGLRVEMEEDGKTVTINLPNIDEMTPKQRDDVYQNMAYILRKEIAKDSKYGLDAMRACSLQYDTDGHVVDFNVPLMDPIQSKRIQMLLNSIIKKTINKQKIAGGPVVQTTAYDNDLHIQFHDNKGNILPTFAESEMSESEYKQFLKDNHAGIAYFECYMSVPNAALEKLITKEDGSLMSVEEIQKAMPEVWGSMSQVIGYRIPTEDKYSMLPLKIKGFLPKAAGQVIMMPKEITYLTGSDFDIDKMYIMMKAFALNEEKKKPNVGDLIKEFQESSEGKNLNTKSDKFYFDHIKRVVENASRVLQGEEVSLSDGLPTDNGELYTIHQKFIDWYRKKLLGNMFSEYTDMNAQRYKAAKRARDNRLLDLQWAVLTNADTASKMLNPGNFDPQKKTGRVIRIIKSGIRGAEDYDTLMAMDIKQLDALLEGAGQHNITLPSSKIYFQRQNMQGSQMVGIFANNNVSHAFCTFQKIGIDLNKGEEDKSFSFDGILIGSTDIPSEIIVLDRQRGFDGQLISKTIASFLAASVDTAKDPVLNDLNVNTFTGGVAMALARMGFDTQAIGLFLSQPVICMLSDHYFKNKTDGYYSGDTAISEVAAMLDMTKEELDKPSESGIQDKSILIKKNLISHLADSDFLDDETPEGEKNLLYQKQVLAAFKILFGIATDLQELTFCTKFNSVSNAVGPTIADTIEDQKRVDRFKDNDNVFYEPGPKDRNGFTNAAEVIENDPILNAFYYNTVGEKGASQRIFESFFPHYYIGFDSFIDKFRKEYTKREKINSKLYNQLLDEYLYFLMTYDGGTAFSKYKPTIPYTKEDRDILVKDLISLFGEVLKIDNRKPNMILDQNLRGGCLRIRKKDEYIGADILAFNGSQMNTETQDKVKRAWSDLITMNDPKLTKEENDTIRWFGRDLFFYTLMRNGFGFSPKTLMHLASVVVRYNATYKKGYNNYIAGLRGLKELDQFLMMTNEDYVNRFIDQFMRNHANNRSIVPNIESKNVKILWGTDGSIEFKAKESEKKTQLYKILLNSDNPYQFITVTRVDGKKVVSDLYKLDDKKGKIFSDGEDVHITYRKVNRLGVVNNFIEYNANEDIEDSYFTDMQTSAADMLEDEEPQKDTGRTQRMAGDDVFDGEEAAFKNAFKKAAKQLEGPQSKDRNLRQTLWDAININKSSKLAQLAQRIIDTQLDSSERQKAMDEMNKVYEEQKKCINR